MSETVFDISFDVKAALREFLMVSDIFQLNKKSILYNYFYNDEKTRDKGLLGIAPTFFDSWSPGAGFIPIISIKGMN